MDFERLYWALKSKGIVSDKEEFWMKMDLKDLESAGAFLPKEIWDGFIIKSDKSKILIKPKDYTK